jgi:hypothetical protein
MIIFRSIISYDLTNKIIYDICNLKDKYWKFGLLSQFNYFKKNINKHDLHNVCFINKKLIGYTLLKKKNFLMKQKKINFLHFDTLIIDDNFRKKQIARKLMNFNNKKILELNLPAFLICDKKIVGFYQKNLWKRAKGSYKKINICKPGQELMIFNS